MDATFVARFVHTGYHLTALEGEQTIESLLVNCMPKGAIIEVILKAKTTGVSRGICQFKEKYGICGNVLSEGGKCRDEEHNAPLDAALEEVSDGAR